MPSRSQQQGCARCHNRAKGRRAWADRRASVGGGGLSLARRGARQGVYMRLHPRRCTGPGRGYQASGSSVCLACKWPDHCTSVDAKPLLPDTLWGRRWNTWHGHRRHARSGASGPRLINKRCKACACEDQHNTAARPPSTAQSHPAGPCAICVQSVCARVCVPRPHRREWFVEACCRPRQGDRTAATTTSCDHPALLLLLTRPKPPPCVPRSPPQGRATVPRPSATR